MSVLDERAIPDSASPPQPRMTRRQRAILVLLLSTTFLLAADFSLLNVAIPVIGDGLGFAVGDLQWIATAFALTAAGFTLLFGRVADIYGRRRIFLAGIALLVLSSLVGGAANEPAVLIAARVAQGVATAMATPSALALLTTSFPEGPLRAKALGVNGAMISAGFTVGAVVGGLLTDLLSWRWAFLINVPVGVAIIVLTPLLLAESKITERARMDVPGAVTVSVGLVSLVYGVSRAGGLGWGSPLVLGFIALGVVLLGAFWRIELRSDAPLASVWILRKPSVRWGNFGGLIAITMQTAVIFLATLYLQEVIGYSAMATGLAFSVLGVSAFLGGVIAPRIVGRFGNRLGLVSGMVLQAVAPLGMFLVAGDSSSIALVLAALTVGAFGHLTAVVSYMITATSGLPDEEQGLATGLATMTQQVGLAAGIPVLSAVATSRIHALEATHSTSEAVLSGVRLALAIDAGVVLLAALVIALLLRRSTEERAAAAL
ncbi:MFS transporter [Kitasatospora atroaurantiaca]|uniref:EmrB/QacA subfamily drug resistance transporter n=1 Tax=Kitasatospora atroaurantiaca TaxID=285545 RepID=A0A561EU32_9ACTN|nr:MFS transporter [Kitasatospora atroaurantiaca]TWE19120.1 EmrB/QacA subfamily drug resistance transporter [Kitasatospora atroaurantiaca]